MKKAVQLDFDGTVTVEDVSFLLLDKYAGPDGKETRSDFKEEYTRFLEKKGYRVVCLGDSVSDIFTARRAYRVFATGALPARCRRENIAFIPFDDFRDVIRGLKTLS